MNSFSFEKLNVVLLLISIVVFAVEIIFVVTAYLFAYLVAIGAAICLLFISYLAFYILCKKPEKHKAFVYSVPLAIILLFIAQIASPAGINQVKGAIKLAFAIIELFFFMFFALAIFLIGGYLFKLKKPRLLIVASLLLFLIGITIIYLFFTYISNPYPIDDEIFYSIKSTQALINGTNPYLLNFGNAIMNTGIGVTFTSSNRVLSIMDYPPLFFLINLPFYLASPSLLAISNGSMLLHYQAIVFTIIYFFTIVAIMERKSLSKPKWLLLFGIAMSFAALSAVANILMISLLLLSYRYADYEYGWVFMGLAASLQEELWIPLLFIIIYSFYNYGNKRGLSNLLGTIIVFALISMPFALFNMHSYIGNIFSPLNSQVISSGFSTIGYLLSVFYPLPFTYYQFLFYAAVLAMIFILLYTNEKRIIGLISLFPFLLLNHAISPYFLFFMSFTIITIFIKEKNAKRRNPPTAVNRAMLISIILIAMACVFVVVEGHWAYLRAFSINVSNQSIEQIGGNSIYAANISYSHIAMNGTYLYFMYYTNASGFNLLGVSDRVLVNPANSSNTNSTPLHFDPNFIPMNGSGKVHVEADLGTASNETIYIRASLFNGNYAYIAPLVSGR